MASLEPILEKLAHAQRKLLRAADIVPAGFWKTPPRPGAWSAAEVIAHVIIIERTVLGAAVRIFTKTPRQTPLLKRFRLPFALAEVRVVRMKTPIPIDPELLCEKEVMFAELREVRARTLAVIEETRNRDLRVYRWRHPFLGSLNAYQWFSFLASHQIRHEKQMREIAADLPKAIQNS
jgi:DinB family protein